MKEMKKTKKFIQNTFKNLFKLSIGFVKLRNSLQFVKDNLKRELVVVEVGVYLGENTERIIKNLNIKKLYLIDPYEFEKFDGISYSEDKIRLAKIEKRARKRLKKYSDKITWIMKKSSEALNDIPDNCDYIYIDGNHLYEYVKRDIEGYYKKIKTGGILGGHDADSLGVARAFIEFIKKHRIINNSFMKGKDWWIVK